MKKILFLLVPVFLFCCISNVSAQNFYKAKNGANEIVFKSKTPATVKISGKVAEVQQITAEEFKTLTAKQPTGGVQARENKCRYFCKTGEYSEEGYWCSIACDKGDCCSIVVVITPITPEK
jgi:hypothetical protein